MSDGDGTMKQIAGAEQITPELAMSDTLILGLRLIEGIDLAAFRRRHGVDVEAVHGALIDEFAGYGIVERTPTHVRLTRRGRLLSNELFQRLLPEPVA
jgi:oxygen-independent coproporphyrinogen-3 oxidase